MNCEIGGGGGGIPSCSSSSSVPYPPLKIRFSFTPISSPTASHVTSRPLSNIVSACVFALRYCFCIPGGGGGTHVSSIPSQFFTQNSTVRFVSSSGNPSGTVTLTIAQRVCTLIASLTRGGDKNKNNKSKNTKTNKRDDDDDDDDDDGV